jgi:iron complex outermembrane receptor protein
MFRKKTVPTTHQMGAMPIILVSLLVRCGVGDAAEAAAAAQYAIEQPSQAVSESLQAIAHETSTSVLFEPSAVRGRVARPVSGHLSAFEAITAALQGTGLTAELMKDGAVVVRPAAPPAVVPAFPASVIPARAPSAETAPNTQTAREAGAQAAAPGRDDGGSPPPGLNRDDTEVVKVEVTGSRLKRVEAEGPTPVNVYTAKDIEQSGQPNLERFLAGLNEVSATSGEGAFGSTGQATVQLRGLPVGTTLVLVNGRRVEAVGSASANLFNLNLIPMAAIDRVEIVPVGSSAVYGGDALAGVVNVILKKSMDGVSLAANLGSGRGFGDSGLSLATGGHGADGSYLLLGSYSRATPLTAAERGSFFQNADYRRFGGPDARVRNCTPGTVSSVSGANLPGLNSSSAAIPQLAAGQTPQVSDFASTAGTANLCNLYDNGNGYPLVYGEETLALHAMGEYKIRGSWFAFSELTLAKDLLRDRDVGLPLTNITVPASNAYNPFGEDVKVTTVLGQDNGSRGLARQTRFTRALVGARGELAADWDGELTVSTTRDNGGSQTLDANVNSTALAAALAASSPSAALNPFTTGRAASDDVLRGIWSNSDRISHGRKDQIGGFVRGSVLQLPAGPVETIVGAETASDHYDVSIPGVVEIHDGRRNSAAYGELRAPLLNAGPAGHDWSLAALTLAARRDRYSDFGSANTYQTGLELRPSRSVLIRASSATSFKPPTLLQTHVTDTPIPAELYGLVDPARGGEAITSGTVLRTTNTALQPERGRANSFGAMWEPDSSLGTRVGATYWQVRVNELISILQPQTVLDYESLFPGFVTRSPSVDGQPGPVTSVKLSETNFGSVDVAGTDMEAAYAWRGVLGRWTATASATRTSEYQVVLAPGAAKQNRLGRRFDDFWAPRWKDRASIDLDAGSWTMGLTGRYLGQYKDEGTSERRLGASWMYDLAGSLDLKKWLPNLVVAVKAASLSLSVANLTNRLPQFVETDPYYDVTQADWRGRYVSTRVSIDW